MTTQKREIKEIRHFFLAEERSVRVNENYEFQTQLLKSARHFFPRDTVLLERIPERVRRI
jgi:hypothetical protein